MSSLSLDVETGRDAILEAYRDELIDAVEQGPESVEKTLAAWCARYLEQEETFRKEAKAFLLLWGLREPERLGPYQLLDVLTIGGMGKIYRAREDVTGRVVAVKTVLAGHLSPAEQMERFDTERRLLSRLHDTHIVPLLATGREGYLLYLVMPFISGVTLRALIDTCSGPASTREPFPTFETLFNAASKVESMKQRTATAHPDQSDTRTPASSPDDVRPASLGRDRRSADYLRSVVTFMEHVGSAVHHIHDAKILHRDLKPSNIMIESSGHSWVIDIGVGRDLETADDGVSGATAAPRPAPAMTRGVGTLLYMAPEQVPDRLVPPDMRRTTEQDARIDIWGLGATLYELITLKPAFEGATEAELVRKILSEPPTRPRLHQPAIPRELEAVCLKALEKDPGARYPNAAAFTADLQRWLAGVPTEAGRANILRRSGMWARRRPAQAGLVAAGVFIISLVTGATVYAAQAQAVALKRQLDLLSVQRLRQPTRHVDWSANAWERIHSLRQGSQSRGEQLQGQAAATLEGIDAHTVHSFDQAANMLAFDPTGERLLMGITGQDDRGRPISRLALGNLAVQQGPFETTLRAFGVVGFRHAGGVPLFLERDRDDPAILRLRDVLTGNELKRLAAPLTVPCAITAHTLSGDGERAAGVVRPLAKRSGNARDEGNLQDEPRYDGDAATLVVWELATGRALRALSVIAKQTTTYDVALSPDGSLLAAWDLSGRRHDVTVWAVKDGTRIDEFPSNHSAVASVAFGRDPAWRDGTTGPGWRLAVGENGGMVTVWDITTHRVKSHARGSSYDVKTIAFSPDGSLLATAGRNEVRIWDAATGNCLLNGPSGNFTSAVAFSPDGRRLAVGCPPMGSPGSAKVLDLDEGRGLRTLRGLQQRIVKVVISGDGRRVAALSNDWELGVFDPAPGRKSGPGEVFGGLLGLADAPEAVFTDNAAVALSGDGSRLACSAGTRAKLWDVSKRRLLGEWALPPALTEAAGFRPDGRLILVRQETRGQNLPPYGGVNPKEHPRVCRAYELREQDKPRLLTEITDFDQYVEHIAATPDAAYFAVTGFGTKSGKRSRILQVYDGSTWARVGSIPTHMPANDMTGMRFDPKGSRLLVTVERGRRDVFEIPSLNRTRSMTSASCVNTGASRWVFVEPHSADTPEMVVLNEQGRNAALLRVVRDLDVTGVGGIQFSPDGNFLVWGNVDGTVTVCDLNEVQRRLAGVGLGWQ